MIKQQSINEARLSLKEMAFGSVAVLDDNAEIPTIYDRFCDADCPKLGCHGLCKTSGDADGKHGGTHTCNKCGAAW